MRRSARAGALGAAGLILLAAAVFCTAALFRASAPLRAQELVADLSSHLIAITTGFTGTDVVLFGAVDGPGDVAVVVQGPQGETVVRRKSRVAGIWLNTDSLGFAEVPGYYTVATTRPLAELAGEAVLSRHEIGVDHLRLVPEEDVAPEELGAFRAALIRNKQEQGLYGAGTDQVAFLGGRLFRTTIYFPANVPTGAYTVGVFLIRDGEVVSAQITPLAVSKVGLSADVSEFATRQSALYGVFALVFAIAAGWLASVIFRKV